MKDFFNNFLEDNKIKFVMRTIFYFIVLLFLVYLYSYSGIDQPHFIYNEF